MPKACTLSWEECFFQHHPLFLQNEKNQIMKSNVWLRLVSTNKLSFIVLIYFSFNDANNISRCGRTISCSGTRPIMEASACSVFPQTKSGSPISCSSTSKLICLDLPILNSFRHLLFGFSFSADGNYEVRYKSNVLIYPDGEVLWVPPAIYQVSDPCHPSRFLSTIMAFPREAWYNSR